METSKTEKLNPKKMKEIIQKLKQEGRLPSQEEIILTLEKVAIKLKDRIKKSQTL